MRNMSSYYFKNTAFYLKYECMGLDTKQNCTLINIFFGNAILKVTKKLNMRVENWFVGTTYMSR